MNKNLFLVAAAATLFAFGAASAQNTQWGEPTGNVQFPHEKYVELPNPNKPNPELWAKVKGTNVSWGSVNVKYYKEQVPSIGRKLVKQTLSGWRGEKLSAQAVVWSKDGVEDVSFKVNFPEELNASASFLRYVMEDDMNSCGDRKDIVTFKSSLSPDVIDQFASEMSLEEMSSRPIWLTLDIDEQTKPGNYAGEVVVMSKGEEIAELKLTVKVLDRVLPEPSKWAFHLDFWQNPYAEARYGGVEPFSPEHLKYMYPQMCRLRDAGQKVITTSIIHKPWGGQTEDYFESMVTWMRKVDGSWAFDYTIFDIWVEYMMDLGIDQHIACYSMIPWNMSFKYYDQRSNSMQEIVTTTNTEEYRTMWVAMLKSLSAHLREKGWFYKTAIAMDERAPSDMMNAFKIIKEADPEFKVSLAGSDHPEIEEELYDYSMASDNIFSDEVFAKRAKKGQITTFYTCCAQAYPNIFTFSPPAEGEWIGWFAAAKGYDGYLRWAFNSYTLEPLVDSRFRKFQAGDSYTVYPLRSSVRLERFTDGVEAYEKVRILREEFTKTGNKKGLEKLDNILKQFELSNFENGISPAETVEKATKMINLL